MSYVSLSHGFLSYGTLSYGSPSFHSFWPFLQRPFKSSTTQRRFRLQHGYCIGVSRQSAQVTVGKGLAQGPYMAARAGVEPTTLRLTAIDSTKAPPCPTMLLPNGASASRLTCKQTKDNLNIFFN